MMFLCSPASSLADEPGSLPVAIVDGEASVFFRYRYEFVDQDGFAENANASTVLLRLDYKTRKYKGFSGFAEFDYIGEMFVNDFNSGAGTSNADRNDFPIIADPKGSDLNQLFVSYAPNKDWHFRAGRRTLNLNDMRFIGSVGWRQNEQSYDGLEATFNGVEKTRVYYSYANRVRRIFGNRVAAGSHRQDTHLLNVRRDLSADWFVVGYAYLLDNKDQPAFSSRTFGIQLDGNVELEGGRLNLHGGYARQSSAYNAPVSFDADFIRLQAIWSRGAWSIGAAYELLGSDNGEGFRTPLATLHKFNGWADIFLTTPGAGLQDTYLQLGYEHKAWAFALSAHDFRSDAGSEHWGFEIDASARRNLGRNMSVLLKTANFDADSTTYDDTIKVWLMLTGNY